jgi:NitT/TauT family transport system substrate-binding protein
MNTAKRPPARRRILPMAGFVVVVACVGVLPLGCARKIDSPANEPAAAGGESKIKICYLGLTCEPAIFAAYEKGFFKEEGLDVELVKTDWSAMREGLATGQFHATYSFIMYLINPVEMGLDIKLTAGIHTGCLRIQAGTNTEIKKVEDLKGKKVGITHLGSPPFLFASRVLANNGLDPRHDVDWVTMPAHAMSKALDEGMVDAVASAEPMGTMFQAKNKARSVCDQTTDAPYDAEYCCIVAVSGKFARENPSAAAKVTRALLKGAKWVSVNPTAAANLAVEKQYVTASAEINAQAIALLKYEPGVAKAQQDVRTAALEMKKAGFLRKDVDPEELAKKAWLDLDGVTDEWIKSLKVEKVAGGGRPPKLGPVELAALFHNAPCCQGGVCLGCCGDSGESLLPMIEEWTSVRPHHLDLDLKPTNEP